MLSLGILIRILLRPFVVLFFMLSFIELHNTKNLILQQPQLLVGHLSRLTRSLLRIISLILCFEKGNMLQISFIIRNIYVLVIEIEKCC